MNKHAKDTIRRALPRSLSPHRILAGPLRGQTIVTSWHDYPAAILGRTERHLLEWFQKNVRTGETWLDVGAHFGYTAMFLSKMVGDSGRVFAFEPMISTAGCVAQTRKINGLAQLSVMPIALGQPEPFDTRVLPATRGMADSTIGNASWHERISVARLDWLWPRICDGRSSIDGIKIDVQGMETEVLRGMVGVLRQQAPKLAIELHRGVSRAEFLSILAQAGYQGKGLPIEPLTGESEPQYADDRSYAFFPDRKTTSSFPILKPDSDRNTSISVER
jgi:FkbM family methyltransferase